MKIPVDLIKELREMTASSVGHCKKALEETGGDIKKAVVLLRKQGLEIAAKNNPAQQKKAELRLIYIRVIKLVCY